MAGRPRKPTKLLLLSKSARKHPDRLAQRAHEPEPVAGLGDPPKQFSESQEARWLELIEVVPAGVLTRMDRPAAELLCKLWAEERDGKISSTDRKLLASLFGKFGLTPSERSKVALPAGRRGKPSNPFQALA